MTTREWTKILKTNPAISQIKLKGEFVKGTITITRHRIIETEQRNYSFNEEFKSKSYIIRNSEIDITLEGSVKSSMNNCHLPKTYNKRQLNNWFRASKEINGELKMRLKLIGGSSEYKIKKITCL